MIFMGFMLVLAYANNLTATPWAWVLFGVQVLFEAITIAAKAIK